MHLQEPVNRIIWIILSCECKLIYKLQQLSTVSTQNQTSFRPIQETVMSYFKSTLSTSHSHFFKKYKSSLTYRIYKYGYCHLLTNLSLTFDIFQHVSDTYIRSHITSLLSYMYIYLTCSYDISPIVAYLFKNFLF